MTLSDKIKIFKFAINNLFVCKMEKREAIVAALHAGKAIPDIIKEIGVCRATIFNVKKALKDRGHINRKPGTGRKAPSLPRG